MFNKCCLCGFNTFYYLIIFASLAGGKSKEKPLQKVAHTVHTLSMHKCCGRSLSKYKLLLQADISIGASDI